MKIVFRFASFLTLTFLLGSCGSSSSSSSQPNGIVVNGSQLSTSQVQDIQTTYGRTPANGNYWYDSKSGLYGEVGYRAAGFIAPGGNYGTLDRNISKNPGVVTGVIVNGRAITTEEKQFLEGVIATTLKNINLSSLPDEEDYYLTQDQNGTFGSSSVAQLTNSSGQVTGLQQLIQNYFNSTGNRKIWGSNWSNFNTGASGGGNQNCSWIFLQGSTGVTDTSYQSPGCG